MSSFDNVYSNYSKPRVNHQWTCAICDKVYVVPALARDCENEHMDS